MHQGKPLRFKWISALEPPKALLKPYLAAERAGTVLPFVPRLCDVVYFVEDKFYQAIYNLSDGNMAEHAVVPDEHKPPGDPHELIELEAVSYCLSPGSRGFD
jgi:hypothetical protein